MKRTTRILALLLIIALLVPLAACSSGSKTSSSPNAGTASTSAGTSLAVSSPATATASPTPAGKQPKAGGTVTIGWANMPKDLFFISNYGMSSYFLAPVCESLARRLDHTNNWTPFLAESLKPDLTANTFTITLKKGIMFHDGSELTADVVKWNFQYMIDSKLGSSIGNPTGFDVPDKYTLVVHFAAPAINWTESLGQVPLYSKDAFDKNGLDFCLKHPVGTGPFMFKEFVPDDHITYVKNSNYWQTGLPYLDQWKIQAIAEPAAQMSAFTSKSIDFICMKDSTTAANMEAMGIQDKHESDMNGYTAYTIYPNSKVEGDPWYKTEVRQAVLLYGIDWDAVALMAGGKTATKSLQFDIKGSLCYVDGLDDKATYDIDKAKSMLTAAGYPNGFSTKIYSPSTTTAAATAVQDQLKKLNITAEIVKVTPQDKSRSDGVTPGLSMVMFTSAYDIVYKVLSSFVNPKAVQFGPNILFSDAFVDAFNKALSAKTPEERAQYGKTAAQLLHFDECKIRTMYMVKDPFFIQDYLKDSNYNVGFELYNITPEKAWLDK